MSGVGVDSRVVKDNVGQDVNVGDWIAYKVPRYVELKSGKIVSFTLTGYPRVRVSYQDTPKAFMTFVKIYKQDE